MNNRLAIRRFLALSLAILCSCPPANWGWLSSRRASAEEPWKFVLPEQRRIQVRDPRQLCKAPIPNTPRPPTIADKQLDKPVYQLSLNEAINTGLRNSEVVRILAGVTANSSGRTIYDVAITNTQIDQQRGLFDPTLRANQAWNRNETPTAIRDLANPGQSNIVGSRNSSYLFDFGLSKRTVTGGVIDFSVNSIDNRFFPGGQPLNPQTNSNVDISYTQPLLRGAGRQVNTIPIVLARIDTERSYFQFKSAVQSHVQGIINGYWGLVLARTNLWARQQQTEQLNWTLQRAEAALEANIANLGEVSQTRVAYENFRASLVALEADVLNREAALRNALGLPPYDSSLIVPVSPLLDERLDIDWQGILELAETNRPDIIELKLILEADQQRLIVSRNRALPQLDGVALYRWDGVDGVMPGGGRLDSGAGQFTDFNVGVNFSVPLGLRQDRALLRQQELVIQRDRANLEQGLHATVHNLAANLRNLDQFYEQYERYQDVRSAAEQNLEFQIGRFSSGFDQFIVALQAIVDWGNAVSNEAQAIVQYNTELASLELQTGTILEAHGVTFYEERFGSIGPLGRLAVPQAYPRSTRPTNDTTRYTRGDKPSEDNFNLRDPLEGERNPDRIEAPPVNPDDFVPPIRLPRDAISPGGNLPEAGPGLPLTSSRQTAPRVPGTGLPDTQGVRAETVASQRPLTPTASSRKVPVHTATFKEKTTAAFRKLIGK